jgi:hypothetical protein
MSTEELNTNQNQSPNPDPAPAPDSTPSSMSANIPDLAKYMRLIGLLEMIGGVLYCLTIVGAIIGLPVYIMGKRLRESADAFTSYNASNSSRDLEEAIERQTRAFFIQYVLAIIGLVIMAINIVVVIVILVSGGFRENLFS